jgi:hypothetical protein
MYTHHPVGATSILRGRSLAHLKLSPRERTKLALAIYEGHASVDGYTLPQAAALAGAKPNSVNSERHRRKQWCTSKIIPLSTPTTLVPAPTHADAEINNEIDKLIEHHGVARIWDRIEKRL